MGDSAIGQGYCEAIRVIDEPGELDGVVTGGQRVSVATKQPVCVRRPGRGMHIGPSAHAEPDRAARQPDGELEVPQAQRRHPQADGGTADGEVGRSAQLGVGVD